MIEVVLSQKNYCTRCRQKQLCGNLSGSWLAFQ